MNSKFLDQDNSSHWHLVPADKRKEWEEWRDSDSDDVPDFAEALGGGPNQVEFITVPDLLKYLREGSPN